jgi:PAS domain S-box-containing protein
MKDQSKTKQELLKENSLLKQRIQELEESESKHKRTEEALLQSEEKFSKAFQTSPSVITISYPESGKFIEVNNTFISVTGFSREEALADASFGLKLWVNEDDRQRVVADLKAGRAVVDQEVKFRTNSGDVMTGLLSAQTIQLSHGPCIFSSIIDITERKEVNRKLQGAVIFQHYLIDALPMPIFYKDSEGRYLGCNSSFEEFFGQKKEQVIGKSVYELSPKEFADIYHEKDLALLQNPGTQIYESTVKDRGGVVHNVIFHKATFPNIDGSVGGLIGAILDITDRKQVEEALLNSERRLHTLVQTIPDLIWLKDKDGVYLSCNTMFERFFGAKEVDIVGKTDYDFVDRELADSFREHDNKAMAAGKTTSNEEWITFADDGHRVFLDTIKTPMYDAWGTLSGVLGIGRDITDRRAVDRIRKALGGTVQAIAVTVEARDPYTAGHQRRVADLARAIATEMNLPIDIIDGIRMAAAIHDLGKISVPAEILSKPTKLKKTDLI